MSGSTWISLEDAAMRLKRPDRQVYGYCRDGQLVYKKESGHIFVSEDSIQAFMELHEGTRVMKSVSGVDTTDVDNKKTQQNKKPDADASTNTIEKPLRTTPSSSNAKGTTNREERNQMDKENTEVMEGTDVSHYSELITSIRMRITKHLEIEQAFCADMLNLLDSLANILKHEETKENQLTQELAQVLSKYAKESEKTISR